jgi:recombination protein RecA
MTALKQGEEVVGNRTQVKVVKNKVAAPFKRAEFDILFGKGISRRGEIVDLASEADIIEKSGAWYAYQGQKLGQGRDNVIDFLRDNPQVEQAIAAAVFAKAGIKKEGGKESPEAAKPAAITAAAPAAAIAEVRKKASS